VALAAAAFGQRRKMLRRSLAAALPDAPAVLAAAGIEPTRRAEELSPEDYLRLAEAADAR
jgi:16S rRNA (adenine1518-N6/adenine1519-N6)-dimethyltransferase